MGNSRYIETFETLVLFLVSVFFGVSILHPLTFWLMKVNETDWKSVVSRLLRRGHRLSSEHGGKVSKAWKRFGDAT